jgi:predicted nucleic acid-binding protein
MILTDTSVVVTCQRRPTLRLLKIIQDHEAAICGVTHAEIYAGARTPADFVHCAALLALFRQVAIPDSLWRELGRNLFTLRTQGITVPFPDALIASVALANALELWTYDAQYALIQGALPQLRLFQEPP